MTGLKAASVRSALMASIVLLGMMTNRRPVLINNLCAAGFLILLVDTNELFNPGFQLSFCVVAAIMLFAGPLSSLLAAPFRPDPFLPARLLSWPRRLATSSGARFASLLAVSAAAWLGSLPLTMGYFHLVSLTSLPANMFAVPLSFAIMAVALLALGTGSVSVWLASIYNQTNWLLAKLLLGIVHAFASVPGSFFYVRIPEHPARRWRKLSYLISVPVADPGFPRREMTGSSTAVLPTATTRFSSLFCVLAGCVRLMAFSSPMETRATSVLRSNWSAHVLQRGSSTPRWTTAQRAAVVCMQNFPSRHTQIVSSLGRLDSARSRDAPANPLPTRGSAARGVGRQGIGCAASRRCRREFSSCPTRVFIPRSG